MKIYRIDIPIYFGYLIIVFDNDFKEVISKLKIETRGRDNLHEFGAFTTSQRNKKGITQYFLIFKKSPNHSEIAHEALHLTNWIMLDRGLVSDWVNDEAQAYLLGWVVAQVYNRKK